MSDLQILLDLLDRGFAGEVCPNGQIICSLPAPLGDYGFTIEAFGAGWISCTVWESFAGGILAVEGFRSLNELVCWAIVVVSNFESEPELDMRKAGA